METTCISLPLANRLVADYVQGNPEAMQFYSYAPYEEDAYRKRVEWLKSHPVKHRAELADGLAGYNRSIGNHQTALANIERLRKANTYVVVGGQQAGVLTGPLYAVHKAISLIQAARRLQEQLQVDVVPVFWVAGEDHDLDEINHIWLQGENGRPLKKRFDLQVQGKQSASMIKLDQTAGRAFVTDVFAAFPETVHTAELRQLALDSLAQSATPADWFARLMAAMFGEHGLIFVESSSPYVRQLQQPVFERVLAENEAISRRLGEAHLRLTRAGYPSQLQLDPESANLFLYENGERLLMERTGDGFRPRGGRYSYSGEELQRLLKAEPDRFSANVVTRPLAQEHLFPTIAFIGGPGEISYWAFYKELFADLGYQLPVILPRTSITLLEGSIQRAMNQVGLTVDAALSNLSAWKEQWRSTLKGTALSDQFHETRSQLLAIYQPLVDQVIAFDPGLRELAAKNRDRLLAQLDFLEGRVDRSLEERHQVAILRVERIEHALVPEGKLQERVYTVFHYLNIHGKDLIGRLVDTPFPFDAAHQVVHI